VDFLHIHAKNPEYRGAFGNLHRIKIHFREFLYDIRSETQQTPGALDGERLFLSSGSQVVKTPKISFFAGF
jgi:hypothetical protein